MEQVFRAGLVDANEQGVVLSFTTRELLRLPTSLVGVYVWSMRSGEVRPVAVSSVSGGGTVGMIMPGEGWGASFMAGLPHLLIGIIIVISEVINGVIGVNMNMSGYIFGISITLLLLGVLIFSIYKGWKRWIATWIIYMFIFTIMLLSVAANALSPLIQENNSWVYKL